MSISKLNIRNNQVKLYKSAYNKRRSSADKIVIIKYDMVCIQRSSLHVSAHRNETDVNFMSRRQYQAASGVRLSKHNHMETSKKRQNYTSTDRCSRRDEGNGTNRLYLSLGRMACARAAARHRQVQRICV